MIEVERLPPTVMNYEVKLTINGKKFLLTANAAIELKDKLDPIVEDIIADCCGCQTFSGD